MRKVYVWIGTIAELIKLFPVMREMESRGLPYTLIASGQNDLNRSDLMGHLATSVGFRLHDSRIRQTKRGLLGWFFKTFVRSFYQLRKNIPAAERRQGVLLIHGDTISTLMGAYLGKLLGFRIAHVEAGLRSFRVLSPFPEEISRRLVSLVADIHFCPNAWALGNLAGRGGIKVDTQGNTLIDSLAFARQVSIASELLPRLAGKNYFVFVIHRQENIYRERLVRDLLAKVREKTREGWACLFVMHEPTRVALESYGAASELERSPGIVVTPRLGYLEFMKILSGAGFIVTDGGSNQEEAFYLGKPCLILRDATERTEGLGHNVILSRHEDRVIEQFLADPGAYARAPLTVGRSPSLIIVDHLQRMLAES